MEYEIIEERKDGCLRIRINDAEMLETNNKSWAKLIQRLSSKFNDEDFSMQMLYEYEIAEAKSKALRLLTRRLYSTGEMKRKLQTAGFSGQTVCDCVHYLTEKQYLNDYEFADAFIRNRISIKSVDRIAYELSHRGIADHIIDTLLRQDEMNSCSDAAMEKRIKQMLLVSGWTEKNIKRIIGSMMRRGYAYAKIKAVLVNNINSGDSRLLDIDFENN